MPKEERYEKIPEITKYLQNFAEQVCACGKKHTLTVSRIVVKKGAIAELPEIVKELQP